MGGNRFESNELDAYLFGDNKDLNYLGKRPIPVSYLIFNIMVVDCIV